MAKHILSPTGRNKALEFIRGVGQAYGGIDATQEFTIDPLRAQEVNTLIELEGQPFLSNVSILPKPEMVGEVVFIGMGGLSAARTATSDSVERTPRSLHDKTNNIYTMHPVENDVAIAYAEIDAWAMDPQFYNRWAQKVRMAISNDRLRVGWHGTSAAATSNPSTNTNGEDVLPGWLYQIKNFNSGSQYVNGTGGAVAINTDTYPNLDFLVMSVRNRIDVLFRRSPDLVAIISEDLVAAEENEYYRHSGRKPEQKVALLDDGRLLKNFAGLPSYSPPWLPDGTVLVTSLDNLHIYYQTSSLRRQIRDYAPKNRFEDFNSRNEAYAIGDYRKVSLVDGITIEADTSTVE